MSESAQVTYPPVDTPKPVDDDVFIVDGALPGLLGKVLPVRMTVIRLSDGGLLLHSPTCFSEPLCAALQALGPVAHLVAPNLAHWTLLQDWQSAFPAAITWAAPGLRERRPVKRQGLRIDRVLGATAPAEWGQGIDLVMIPGALGFHEAALFHRPSRTLVLTDLVQNLEREKLPALARPLARLLGNLAPDGMPPPYLRAVIRWRGAEAIAAVQALLALHPRRAIFAHGRWFETDAEQQLRHSFRWLLA